MAMPCSICFSPFARQIDAALLDRHQSFSAIALRYGVGRQALWRHRHSHLRAALAQAGEVKAMLDAEALAARMRQLEGDVDWARERAKQAGDPRTLLLAVQQGRGNVEALARLGAVSDLERRIALLEGEPDSGSDAPDGEAQP